MKKILVLLIAFAMCGLAFGSAPAGTAPIDKATLDKEAIGRSFIHTTDSYAPVDSISNGLVRLVIDDHGDFVITTADGRPLLYRGPINTGGNGIWSTDIRVKIDQTVWDLAPTNGCNGTTGNVAQYLGHTTTATDLTCTYRIPEVTGAPGFTVLVIHTPVMLSASTGMIHTRTVVMNNTNSWHMIGVLYEYDTMINLDDYAYLYFGPNYQTVETCYDAPFAHNYWQAIPYSNDLTGCGLITGLDAVTPDRIAFGYWQAFWNTCWDRICSGLPYGDSGVLLQWNTTAVAPNGTRDVATYYGECGGQVQPGDLEVRVAEPSLYCDNSTIVPNPFQMVVTVHNNNTYGCENVQVHMSDGSGDGGTSTILSTNPVVIPSLPAGATANVSFMAGLTNTSAGGCVNFTVTASSVNCQPGTEMTFCVHVPPCEPVCRFYSCNKDMGDLYRCNYPTLWNNPGHMQTNVAWLGRTITAEPMPNILNNDPGDDGVIFLNVPWTPCDVESVLVTVTAGTEYNRYVRCGGHLFLSAWKDGNLDGDFCDFFECPGAPGNGGEAANGASECIILNAPIPGPGTYLFTFRDPGLRSLGHPTYEGRLRFRLMSGPHDCYAFGQTIPDSCLQTNLPTPNCNGTFALDSIGEVEDYVVRDLQLDVQLASFSASSNSDRVILDWTTASETSNHHFEILRDGARLAEVPTLGNDAAGHRYRYEDDAVNPNTTYTYELMAVDEAANARSLGTRTVTASPPQAGVITEYALHQNYPNPFNPITNIAFDLPEAGVVTLKVFNMVGQEVATLVHGQMPQGTTQVTFDASALPSALYFYRLEVNGFVLAKKMLLTK
jgi:hypothetical protein